MMLLVTGVAVALFALDIEQLRLMTLLSFGGMVASAGIFGATFIETGKLTSAWRRALIASAIWVAYRHRRRRAGRLCRQRRSA